MNIARTLPKLEGKYWLIDWFTDYIDDQFISCITSIAIVLQVRQKQTHLKEAHQSHNKLSSFKICKNS